MCGIVGYAGGDQAAPILLDGLSKLEYRGYDSAGVVVHNNGKLVVVKSKGRLSVLSGNLDGGKSLPGKTGLGHTRWATHGEPSDVNSHPHITDSGKFAVIHNGIIENYLKLKDFLLTKGAKFNSETDTEVIVLLIEHFYKGDFLQAVRDAVKLLEGSYALGIMCEDYPETLIAARKDSPLIFGYGEGCNYFASDAPAIMKYTRRVSYLDDNDMLVMTPDSVVFYDALEQRVDKEIVVLDWDVAAAEKGGYEHFMMKEIMEQPDSVRKTISPRIKDGRAALDELALSRGYLESINKIYFVACGTASYVGIAGKYIVEKLCRIHTETILASEFRYCDPVVDDKTLVVIISQSGETADTLAALREAKARGGMTLAIVNVVGSSIAKAADKVIYTWAGVEKAVASTKAYSTQLALVYLLALHIADTLGTIVTEQYDEMLNEVLDIPAKIADILKSCENIQQLASKFYSCNDVFFLGRNLDYATCLEGSLKLKEIAYIHSEAYPAGELKHGPLSLVENGTLVVALATNAKLFDKTMSNVKEVKARGATVIGVTTERFEDEIMKTVDYSIVIPETHPLVQPSLSVIPLQLFAYYMSSLRGCDIDMPRNLAKSVTVE